MDYTPISQITNNPLQKVEFIGRDSIKKSFLELLGNPGNSTNLIYFHGEGGVGKTRLLDYLLKEVAQSLGLNNLYAADLVDLVHIHTHTQEGFMRVLAAALPSGGTTLKNYPEKLKELDGARLAGELAKIPMLLKEARTALINDLAAISRNKVVLLAFDTSERWVYSPKSGNYMAEAWGFLKELALQMEKAIILLAGRDFAADINVAQIIIDDATRSNLSITEIRVSPFDADETHRYINAVLKNYDGFERNEEETKAIWTMTEGRPISLALYLDQYLVSSRNRNMRQLIDEARIYQHANTDKKKEIIRNFEHSIIKKILENPQVADVVRVIGRAPKGVDSELLGRLLNIDIRDARNRLALIRNLVFAKEYNYTKEYKLLYEEPRIFLHDRMYDLLRETTYTAINDLPEATRAQDTIKKYYLDKIKKTMDALAELYNPLARNLGPQTINLPEISERENRRNQLYSELVYYCLRSADYVEGLRAFCRYAHEAVLSNSPSLLTLLTQELLSYLANVDSNPHAGNDRGFHFFMENLLQVLDVQRAFSLAQHERVVKLAKEYSEKINATTSEFNDEKLVLLYTLDIWDAYSGLFANRLDAAENILSNAFNGLRSIKTDKEWLIWYITYMLGLSSRALGYYSRVVGRHTKALNYYGRALQYWRKINLQVEIAYTKNDMGFAQAEQGKFFDAGESIAEALKVRRTLALGRQIGLSINTQAHLEIRRGNFEQALRLASSAYTLFESLVYRRGIGLVMIALAESERRLSDNYDGKLSEAEQERYLLQARDYARRAAELFSSKQLNQADREVEARIELGCALRNLLRHIGPDDTWERQDTIRQSEEALRTAAELAHKQHIQYRQADALVNLAWLQYYIGHRTPSEFARIDQAVAEAEDLLCNRMSILPGQVPENKSDTENNILWTQLGKLFTLKGNVALEQKSLGLISVDQGLDKAAEAYLLSMEYNQAFGTDARDTRHAKRWINQNIDELTEEDRTNLVKKLLEHEKRKNLTSSNLQDYLRSIGLWIDEEDLL